MQRPWKVGLYKALQKPWETLSQYIKDTVCSSSLLLILLPSSSSPSPDYSPFISLQRLFSSSSTRLQSVSSFIPLFNFCFYLFPDQPSFLALSNHLMLIIRYKFLGINKNVTRREKETEIILQ